MSLGEPELYSCRSFLLEKAIRKELEIFRKKRGFKPKEWIDEKCKLFNDYMSKAGLKACVVSCSGGIDSASTIALCHYASKMEGSPIKKIVGIAQPIHSTPSIQNRAYELKKFATDIITVDQSKVFDMLNPTVEKAIGIKGKQFAKGQLKSYMRTPVGYYVAQLISQDGFPCVVMGTGNFDEDGFLYYFCKAGDGVADIQLINDLHKSETYLVGKELKVPISILGCAPSADLWDGQTDEGELGFSYDFVEFYTEWLQLDDGEKKEIRDRIEKDEAAKKQLAEAEKKILSVHRRNKHKEVYPVNINIRKFVLKKE